MLVFPLVVAYIYYFTCMVGDLTTSKTCHDMGAPFVLNNFSFHNLPLCISCYYQHCILYAETGFVGN